MYRSCSEGEREARVWGLLAVVVAVRERERVKSGRYDNEPLKLEFVLVKSSGIRISAAEILFVVTS